MGFISVFEIGLGDGLSQLGLELGNLHQLGQLNSYVKNIHCNIENRKNNKVSIGENIENL